MIQVGIVGGTGYVAGELLRILMLHTGVEIRFVYSHSHAGEKITTVHDDLFPLENMYFTDKIFPDADVVFLCLGHGHSSRFLTENHFSEKTKIIDLSNDFRLKENRQFGNRHFVYGLTEINHQQVQTADSTANPGCFATAIQLALLPLAHDKLLENEIHIHGITGSTGAGKGLSETTHFSWRNNNISVYKAFTHQHLGEIKETLTSYQKEASRYPFHFIPFRGDFSRGIFVTAYTRSALSEKELQEKYRQFYAKSIFTRVTDQNIHLKQVVNTNYCLIHVEKHENMAFITAAIDNLLKGAAGQAVENMNLMCGFPQDTGLKLKAVYY